jgi:hypothetical protein
MITKLTCTCGRHLGVVACPDMTAAVSQLWQDEHAGCDPVYYAAYELVAALAGRLERQNGDVMIAGRWCHTLDEAVRTLTEASNGRS